MQNSVFNRKLFQTKEARNTLRGMGGVSPEISGIVASSQPLINEAMSAVRRPETSAIPMDIAMGMNATRAPSMSDPMQPAGAMPMPAGNTDLLAPPPVAAPAPAPQMAEAPSLNPMQPGVKAMAGGGETTPEEPGFFSQLNTGFNKGMEKYITTTRPFSPLSKAIDESDIDITDEAGTVEQKLQEVNDVIDDPDVSPQNQMRSVIAIAEGDPTAKDLKAEADRVNRKLGMPKLNTKQSFSKMLKNIQGNLESSAGFALAASKNPRFSGAVAEAGKGLADQTLALEVDAQKTAAANAETERLLRLKASLTPATAGSSLYRKSMRPTEARGRAYQLAMEATRDMYFTLPEGFTTAEEYAQDAGKTAYEMALVGGDDGDGGGGGGGGGGGFATTPEGLLAQAQDAIKDDPSKKDAIVNELKRRGVSTEGIE